MKKKVTLEEVARLAQVSRATVSRVVNDLDSVNPEYRERVLKAIEETGYRPNLAARSLVSRRSNIIGLVIPSVARTLFIDPYFPALIESISRACNRHDYILSLFIFHSNNEQQQIYDRALGNGLIDGLIVTVDKVDDPFIPQLIKHRFPFVYIGRPANTDRISFVDVDNTAGAYTAVTHLLGLGYQRIAMIAAPLDTTVGVDRHAGFINALEEHGYPVDEPLVAMGDFTQEGGYRAMKELLPYQPDAVFAASDLMALGALQAIRQAGLRVPQDIAIVGFDDLPPALLADPPLTTIRQPVYHTGMTAVETLIDLLDTRPDQPRHVMLPTELVVRSSCGANGNLKP